MPFILNYKFDMFNNLSMLDYVYLFLYLNVLFKIKLKYDII